MIYFNWDDITIYCSLFLHLYYIFVIFCTLSGRMWGYPDDNLIKFKKKEKKSMAESTLCMGHYSILWSPSLQSPIISVYRSRSAPLFGPTSSQPINRVRAWPSCPPAGRNHPGGRLGSNYARMGVCNSEGRRSFFGFKGVK